MTRRGFLGGLAGVLAAGMAPAIIHNPMKIVVPKRRIWTPASLANFNRVGQLVADFDGDSLAMQSECEFYNTLALYVADVMKQASDQNLIALGLNPGYRRPVQRIQSSLYKA